MKNRQSIQEAIILGLLVELSLRERYKIHKQNAARKKLRKKIKRHLDNNKLDRRLITQLKNIAIDGLDGISGMD